MISIVCVFNNKKIMSALLLKGLVGQTAAHELFALDNTKGRFKSAAEALNYGGSKAKGEYIMFVHQDVRLPSKTWLEDVENALGALPDLGIAGVAGNSKETLRGVTNVMHGSPPRRAGRMQLTEPTRAQTLDECLVLIPRKVFRKLKFDEQVCDDWHLYAVDYALSAAKRGVCAYILPAMVYHASAGASMSDKYYSTLRRLLEKHRGAGWICTTCGFWNQSLPIDLQKIRAFQLFVVGVAVLWKYGARVFLEDVHWFFFGRGR